jgi:hypothetical protein
LTIAVSTPTATASGTELQITGTYVAIDVSDDDIALTGDDKDSFTNFSAIDGTFSATLPDTTAPGIYILQLVANNVVSNPIIFSVSYDDTGAN